jgi:hypothetical protein
MSGVRHGNSFEPYVRVLIADLPDLQADVLAKLVAAEPDMVVVGRVVASADLRSSIDALAPDVVVVAPTLGRDCPDFLLSLAGRPDVGVIAIDERSGTITRIAVVPDGTSWPSKVIGTIRTAAPQHGARHRSPPTGASD